MWELAHVHRHMCFSVPQLLYSTYGWMVTVLQESLWEPEPGNECSRCRWEAGGVMFCSVWRRTRLPRWEQELVTALKWNTLCGGGGRQVRNISGWEKARVRDGARVLHFAVFYLYLRHTTAQGSKDLGRNRGEGWGKWSECMCVCAACNVEMNDL